MNNAKVELHFLGSGDAFGSGGLDQTCFYVKGSEVHFLIDCGCSALVSLYRARISPSLIDLVIVSHLHADHFGGIPFLMRQQYFEKRQKPLTIVGPKGIKQRVLDAGAILFPSAEPFQPSFEIIFVEYEAEKKLQINDAISVLPFPVEHVPQTLPHALRITVEGKIIAFSGDTRWTETLVDVAQNADIFICEAYTLHKPSRIHMHYQALVENEQKLRAKRILLTHCSNEVLEAGNLKFKRADEVKMITI